MAAENKRFGRFREKLKDTYRLVVMNNETFEEVGSYKLSLLNVYIMLCSIVLLVALVVISIIIFTPIKRYIPGYGDISQHKELSELYDKYVSLEEELQAQYTYTQSVKKMLVGDTYEGEEEIEETEEMPESLLNIQRIEEDELLRKEIELNEQIAQNKLLKADNPEEAEKPLEQIYFFPPVNGEISASFKAEDKHYGVDVMAPKNTPIKAALSGYVITSDWTLETGKTIGIQHSNNILSFYKHNSALLKKVGDYVQAGEAVALIGNTGTLSSGPHLHFELWNDGKPVDPELFINFN